MIAPNPKVQNSPPYVTGNMAAAPALTQGSKRDPIPPFQFLGENRIQCLSYYLTKHLYVITYRWINFHMVNFHSNVSDNTCVHSFTWLTTWRSSLEPPQNTMQLSFEISTIFSCKGRQPTSMHVSLGTRQLFGLHPVYLRKRTDCTETVISLSWSASQTKWTILFGYIHLHNTLWSESEGSFIFNLRWQCEVKG